MSDMRRLIESLDKLAEAAANVVQLPLGAPKKLDPATHAFGQMGSVLTKPAPEPEQNNAAAAPKPVATPGQKSLPGFNVTRLKPETPAYIPKQPWLDPKGSSEPAYMRKAVGTTPAEPLGVIGGTGPDAKFEKLPGAANEPSIPKPQAVAKSAAPRVKVGAGSEYSNVYAPVKGSAPSFADVQYAKDLQRELEKTPDDLNLQAELKNLQRRGIVAEPRVDQEPELAPLAEPNARDDMQRAMRGSGIPIPASSSASMDNVPSTVSPLRYGQETVPGMTREFKEFSNFLDNTFPVKAKKLKEQRKGMPQRPTEVTPLEFGGGGVGGPTVSGPRVTPGPVPNIPPNVNVPAYQRKLQPSSAPQGVEVPATPKTQLQVATEPKTPAGKAANAEVYAQPKAFGQHPDRKEAQARQRDQELMKTKPGDFPPLTYGSSAKNAEPLPSTMTGPKKMLSPAAVPVSALPAAGGGGKDGASDDKQDNTEPTTITTSPVELWRPEDLPSTERSADIPVEPASVSNIAIPKTSTVKAKTEPAEKPKTEPETSSGTGKGFGGGVGTGSGTGIGSDSSIGSSSPLKHGQETVPGMTKESLSRKFYNQFKNFMLTDDSSLGKFK